MYLCSVYNLFLCTFDHMDAFVLHCIEPTIQLLRVEWVGPLFKLSLFPRAVLKHTRTMMTGQWPLGRLKLHARRAVSKKPLSFRSPKYRRSSRNVSLHMD